MCLYILKYIFNVLCLTCLTYVMSDMLDINIIHSWLFDLSCLTCSTCHMISLDFINSVTFISLLSFLSQEVSLIMSKCCLDHFSLTQFIFVKDVQMLSSCDCCTKQKKFCVVSDKFNKYSECVCLKKSCLLFSDFLTVNVVQLLKTCEKIEKKQTVFLNEKQCLFETFQATETKKY